MEANKEATGELDELLRIGALGETIGDYQLALQAYEITIASVGDSQADWRLLRAARAHSEIGSVLAETNKPIKALEAYKRSQEIYMGLLKDSDPETKKAAKIEMQRLRKIITALLQIMPTN